MVNQHPDSTLSINLKSIRDNYRLIKSVAAGAETAAVVKANAYGLGVREISTTLQKSGCKTFFVATLDEALEFRDIFPSSSSPRRRGSLSPFNDRRNRDSRLRGNDIKILVFNGIRKNQEKVFRENKIIPVLNNLEETKLWSEFCNKIEKKLPAALHVDTGMNRLGLDIKEAEEHASALNQTLDIKYLMSHLACADTPAHAKNKEQLKSFNRICKYFPGAKKSLANSSGVFLEKCYHFDLARPGIAIYGGNPQTNKKNPMKPVVSLTAKIVQLRKIDRHTTVGYGATATVENGSVLATVPVGYADGYLRSLGNSGYCFIDNIKVPIIGRVSMDLITIDVTKIKNLRIGKDVELIGKNITVDEIAARAGTISYEILTRLGGRFNRIYLEK